jgi:hypothetical protein
MRNRLLAGLFGLSVLALTASPALAQIPDEFKNLKVLPADVSKDELVATMKNFAISLGVRCEFCHVGPPGGSLDAFDFAADDKEGKKIARVMMRMKNAINGDYLSQAGHHDGGGVQVDCATCHRGKDHPGKPEEILKQIMSGR